VPLQGARVVRSGTDITVVSSSHALTLCEKAADALRDQHSIEAEVIDLRSIKPLDLPTIVASAQRTGCVLVVDGAWPCGGVAAEVLACLAESNHGGRSLKCARLTLPDRHAPSSGTLEAAYYLTSEAIAAKAVAVLE
jgi:pyruvate/2-oxoglutarate/acetoin dehydrogenase E1 component